MDHHTPVCVDTPWAKHDSVFSLWVSPGVVCEAELSFMLEPSDIIAVQEQPLTLHCQVKGIPPLTVQWRHNGLLLAQDRHHTTFINGSLLIRHFLKSRSDGSSDEGDYECVAQNSFGLVVSRRARIQAASKFCWTLTSLWAILTGMKFV